ncbi:MAG: hypothetical protein AABZ30_04750 [Myxococcota bacterium]
MKNCACGAAVVEKGNIERKAPGLQERVMRCAKGHTLVRTIFRPLASKTKPNKGRTFKFLTILEPTATGAREVRESREPRADKPAAK